MSRRPRPAGLGALGDRWEQVERYTGPFGTAVGVLVVVAVVWSVVRRLRARDPADTER